MPTPTLADSVARLRDRTDGPDGPLLAAFADDRDEAAFRALLRRHGPLVWAVAVRHTPDSHAAEDAFQATFLALARAAGRLTTARPLAGWLHTVAVRFARRTGRLVRSTQLTEMVAAGRDPLDVLATRELLAAADEELGRLPDRYRLPVILCCLQGLSRDEAAAELGWSAGTLKGRLERARGLLRRRLAARGLGLPAALAGVAVTPTAAPARLTAETTTAAVRFADGPVPGAAAALAATTAGGVPWVGWGVAVVALVVAVGIGLIVAAPGDAPPSAPAAGPAVDRTDRHGDPLPPGAVARLGRVRQRAPGAEVAVTPDGAEVVTVDPSLVVRRFDAATGARRSARRLDAAGHTRKRLSATGRLLATVSAPEGGGPG